jgi:hypothetical protein
LFTFISPEIATSINIHVPFPLSWTMTSGLLLRTVLSVCTGRFHNMLTLPSWLVLIISVHAHSSDHCLNLSLLPCMCQSVVEHTHYNISLCTVFYCLIKLLITSLHFPPVALIFFFLHRSTSFTQDLVVMNLLSFPDHFPVLYHCKYLSYTSVSYIRPSVILDSFSTPW